ncbi:alpha/beta hydrolase [Rhizobium leguminosarum]|uniref:alpha/beta fold hydrolase n=1 Tax=Rhizobium leguminosarum TaxID=384 RepID=UPI001C9426E2|nr:alpha/beta hydrolase [Rhizobium leguminosarum]MBY5775353.1 alpha/beta hydrolase [Rhizobium leguminosarum]
MMPSNSRFEFSDRVTSTDGIKLAVRCTGDRGGPAVILSHGSFSNDRCCRGLAAFLAHRGYTCWTFDWRGHGESEHPPRQYSFDDIAQLDVPAVIDAVAAHTKGKIFWIGHSGGGLAFLMWMARFPDLATRHVSGLVMLASQATGAAWCRRARVLIFIINFFLGLSAKAPGHWFKVGSEAESALLIRQWCQWNLTGIFSGLDGFDYGKAVSKSNLPILALAAAGDRYIAPVSGCDALASMCGCDVTFKICGREQGFREDYTHNRILSSRNANSEIWPLVELWIKEKTKGRADTLACRDAFK